MSVGTNTANEQVDTTSLLNHLLVMCTLSFQILGVAVQDVDILFGDVDMVEQVASHKRVITLGVFLGQVDILVHVERHHVLKGHTAFLVSFNKTGIHTFG